METGSADSGILKHVDSGIQSFDHKAGHLHLQIQYTSGNLIPNLGIRE